MRLVASMNVRREGAGPDGKPLFTPASAVFGPEESLAALFAWAQKMAQDGRGEINGAIRIEQDRRDYR